MPRLLLLAALWLAATHAAAVDLYSDPALDYQRSALVVAGRVVGIEREEVADAAAMRAGQAYVVYSARIRIAACYKGEDHPPEILVPIGGFWAALTAVDTSLQSLERDGGQRPLALEVGGMYLLFLNKSTGDGAHAAAVWHPRSQQASILPIITRDQVPTVGPAGAAVPLERYLAQAKVAAPTVRPGTP